LPWLVAAAAVTAQWQAADTSHERPLLMSSNAPLRTGADPASPGCTDAAPANPVASSS
jgi:hypothetical protein